MTKKTAKKEDQPSKYGTTSDIFDSDGFVINSSYKIEKEIPSRAWLHVLNNGLVNGSMPYMSSWSPDAHGFSAYRSINGCSITGRSTEIYKPLNTDKSEKRSFFLRDEEAKTKCIKLFSQSAATITPTGFATESETNEILSRLEVICPDGSSFEVWELTLTNNSGKKRSLDLFVQLNWNPQTNRETVHPSHLLNLPEYRKGGLFTFPVARNPKPLTAWMVSEIEPEGFELALEDFFGSNAPNDFPQAVINGVLNSPKTATPGLTPCAALHLKIQLPPKGEWSKRFALGITKGDETAAVKEIDKIKKGQLSAKGFASAVKEKQTLWNKTTAGTLVKTPSPEFNRFFNVLTKQQLTTASLFGNAEKTSGFRDRMQAIEALVPIAPAKAKEMLLDSIRFQMRDGRIINSLPLNDELPTSEEAALDNILWMCNAVVRYIYETGDFSFLEEQVPFYDHRLRIFESIRNGKVYDHMMAGMHCLFDFRGKFGFCKIGGHDMNRALTRTTKQGGVSATLTMAIMRTAQLLLPIARMRGQKRDIGYFNSIGVNMQSNLDNYGWNGTHYTYAYDDESKSIGGTDDTFGKVHLSAQTWALLSGTADAAGKTEAVLKALETLYTPLGYSSLAPSYPLGFDSKGGIKNIPPGLFENGGIELYGQGLTAYMFADRGMGDKALQTILNYIPDSTKTEISTSLPTQLSEFRAGPESPFFGRDLFDNFNTGIAIFRLAMERITGVYPVFEGLLLNPSLPSEWSECSVQKIWRGIKFSIKFHNPSKKCGKVKKVTANGKDLPKTGDNNFVITFDAFKEFAGTDKPVCIDALIDG
ncbi:MAG: hypothetical protein JNL74_05670 [Fibrobacteres bacterium]|nr:hypothetical protein [Fibrobacterota bacterium]